MANPQWTTVMIMISHINIFNCSTMKDKGGDDSSTSRNTAFTVESPLFSTVNPKVVRESVALKIASVTCSSSSCD